AAMKNDYAGQFCVGIVDIVKDFNNFKKGFYKINNYGDELLLYKHDNHQQYLVYIKDGAERFIWNCCQSANVDLTLYGLPNSYENLVQISKHPLRWTHEQKSNFKRLFKELIKIKNNGFYVLSNWICYLNEKREKSDEQEIIKLN
ncbi:MAG TPA: hypothetical protein PLU78_03445, partial [Chitinophagales bacterium]|nr:hypothetical protein [Chitinophagales bacterium]